VCRGIGFNRLLADDELSRSRGICFYPGYP